MLVLDKDAMPNKGADPKLGRAFRRRKPITLSQEEMVDFETNGKSLPQVIKPKLQGIDLPKWVAAHRLPLRDRLHQHGALLFRGFASIGVAQFQATVQALSGELLTYMERTSPRKSVQGKVYTSTEYPPAQPIFLHNEQSYNINWCGKISFFCQQAPEKRGQTPLADTRKILKRIDPQIREKFERLGYMYVRNYAEGMGLPWREVFQADHRSEVEAYCRRNAISWEWKGKDRLRTRQVRPLIRRHPESGEVVWFNHCTFFHVTTLPTAIQLSIIANYDDLDMPNQTLYGNGEPIELAVIEHLRQAYLSEKTCFDWQAGDILIIDNMLACHGREPFEGPRLVLTAMSEIIQDDDRKTSSV